MLKYFSLNRWRIKNEWARSNRQTVYFQSARMIVTRRINTIWTRKWKKKFFLYISKYNGSVGWTYLALCLQHVYNRRIGIHYSVSWMLTRTQQECRIDRYTHHGKILNIVEFIDRDRESCIHPHMYIWGWWTFRGITQLFIGRYDTVGHTFMT